MRHDLVRPKRLLPDSFLIGLYDGAYSFERKLAR